MKKITLFLLLPFLAFSQGYTSYFTGNTTNITTNTEFGVCLMGGATEHDNAMRWLLQKANGGDVVVLRSTGSNGYNDYLYSQLGVAVNSVETIVITSAAGAISPYVLNKVANAEMIWFAGGTKSDAEMVCKGRARRWHSLLSECAGEFFDGGAKALHHLLQSDLEVDAGCVLGRGGDDVGGVDHKWGDVFVFAFTF